MYKNISSALLASAFIFSAGSLAEPIQTSNLRYDFGGSDGLGIQYSHLIHSVDYNDSFADGFFVVTPPDYTSDVLVHINGDILPRDAYQLDPVFGNGPELYIDLVRQENIGFAPHSGSARVAEGSVGGRDAVSLYFSNEINVPYYQPGFVLQERDNRSPYSQVYENEYQVVIIEREDLNTSWEDSGKNYDIEFRYDQLEWYREDNPYIPTGFSPAEGGGVHLLEMRGNELSLVSSFSYDDPAPTTPELVTEGPGSADNPILPSSVSEETSSWSFNFDVQDGFLYAIDPDVAVGYDYQVNSGPLFSAIQLPTGFDDDLFDIFLWDTAMGDWELAEADWQAGDLFTFINPVDRVRITGIDTSNMVDPNSPTAFVANIAFDGSGQVDMSQTALVEFVSDNVASVPAPASIGLFMCSLGLMFVRRQRALRQAA
ncbi:hypothetical protein RJ41_06365 [Alteromonas marina]|uniref:PEP-CTERM protein-sorting domain-containing protein n=1 Tax=Alteromonas marina TaxID=203795 RepID=A0A0B3YAS4_9ALTE|nr:hypothetical protein [Alteromonas marina]KHT54158.1 hypothetical protein RJ41_06365 [Alteromonas marina]